MRAKLVGVIAALAAVALLAGSAAESATPSKRYLRFNAEGNWSYSLDYGDDPNAVYNGKFSWFATVKIRAIAVYSGGSVSIPAGAMIVYSKVSVVNEMTQWAPGGHRLPTSCDTPYRETEGLRVSGGGYITISNSGLYVNPGRATVSSSCVATESLIHHGLPGGPTFTLPTPGRSRFSGRSAFAIGCHETFTHDWEGTNQLHKFDGSALLMARFTPFPQSQIAATKRRLRAQVGTEPVGMSSPPLRDDCL